MQAGGGGGVSGSAEANATGLIPPAVAVCVRELGSHPRLTPIVARIHEEAAALATILEAAAAHLQQLDNEEEEREAQAAVDAAGPSPMDAALAEAAAALAAEDQRIRVPPGAPPLSWPATTVSAHFDGLYRQLVADAASAHDLRARERDKADEETMRRLAKGSVRGPQTLAASLTR